MLYEVITVSCSAGGGGEPFTGIESASPFGQASIAGSPGAPESDAAIDASSDAFDDPDAAFNISAVAGFESGLQRVAHIGGTIAAGKRDEVIVITSYSIHYTKLYEQASNSPAEWRSVSRDTSSSIFERRRR